MPATYSTMSASPGSAQKYPPKSMCFELLLDDSTKVKARIPLRVLVNTHDTTESIVTTVKSFYGIYDGNGVSFEDKHGNVMIASYENFEPYTTVYVRAVPGQNNGMALSTGVGGGASIHNSPRKSVLGEPFHALPPHMRDSQSPTRSSSRHMAKGSVSPSRSRGRRNTPSQHKGTNATSRGSSAHGSQRNGDYSDSDAGHSSVSGSRKARSEQYTADIDRSNIVSDGGRRGGLSFTSATLPMFPPSQVPGAVSHESESPLRRGGPHEGPAAAQLPQAKLYDMNAPPLMSPRSFNTANGHDSRTGAPQSNNTASRSHSHHLRGSTSQGRISNGILPTPDPTVASCISDEDVARTLMALGQTSSHSYGRTSTSTMDETFSGVADASSTGVTSDSEEYSEDEARAVRSRKSTEFVDGDYEHVKYIKSEYDEHDGPPRAKKVKTKMHDGPGSWRPSGVAVKSTKLDKPRAQAVPKSKNNSSMKAPPLPSQVRKSSSTSSLNIQTAIDDEDLSTKPRCQRCRKSKKGCDRQRPCGRCKDAGIGIEGCVSEDEGNGRKGRYGRHMGVSLKKGSEGSVSDFDAQNTAIESIELITHGSPSKKRKR